MFAFDICLSKVIWLAKYIANTFSQFSYKLKFWDLEIRKSGKANKAKL